MPLIAAHELSLDEGCPEIYNGYDCIQTNKILTKLLKLPTPKVYDMARGMQGFALEMSLRGFLIDPDQREREILSTETLLRGLDECLQEVSHSLWNRDLNYDSRHQIMDLLYNVMKVPKFTKWHKGELTTPMNAAALEKLCEAPRTCLIPQLILACRSVDTYLEKLNTSVDPDWRMRNSNNIVGTNEGRWSTSKSPLGTGGNMQNITEKARKMFIAPEGHKLCGIDKEQAEARWVGFYCGILFGDWSYLDLLESQDGHTAVARMVWKDELPWTGDIKKDRQIAEMPYLDETYRQKSKKLSHATNILGKPQGIAAATNVPVKNVIQYQEAYFAALPCIPRYHLWLANAVQTRQFLTNAFGRRRDFTDRPDADETVRQAAAYMQASSNADDIDTGINRLWWQMKDQISLLTQEHDAVYFDFSEKLDEIELVAKAQRLLKVEFDLGFRQFSVPTEAKTGWNKAVRWEYRDGKSVDVNPRGLDKVGAMRATD
jgi:DNA polymerase I-like protein with 3'-5' exonuclease and polymerase domains